MRVLWTHNFDPEVQNRGVFVHKTAEGIRARGIDLHLEYLGNLRSLPQLFRARKHVRSIARNFDLVHAQFGSACSFVTSAVDDTPKILTVRGSDWKPHSLSFGFAYVHTRLAAKLTKLSIGSFDTVIAVSRRVAEELARFAPQADLQVLPSPIDLTQFAERDKAEARAALGFPNCTEKWVLFNSVNMQNPIKRYDLAKQAFDIARRQYGNLRLRLATGISHKDMPLFVSACDAILCTSENEGWPNSVKEALACNVPFVATDVSDLRDIASRDPSCRVCAPDPVVLAENLCDVLSGPPPRDLRRHVSDMSLDAVSDKLASIYRSLLASSPAAYLNIRQGL